MLRALLRLCVRRCASALEVESAPFLLGQIDLFSPSERIDTSHAKMNCCGQHGTTTAGATRTTAATTFFNQLLPGSSEEGGTCGRRCWDQLLAPFFLNFLKAFIQASKRNDSCQIAMLPCSVRSALIENLGFSLRLPFARGNGDNLSTEAAETVQMRRLFGK